MLFLHTIVTAPANDERVTEQPIRYWRCTTDLIMISKNLLQYIAESMYILILF